MPFNTRNPIPSGDLRDLDDNARNIDTWANDKTKLSHPDRFGVERRTWHGIEQEANLNIQRAIDAKNAAQEAAMMSGFSKYADTLAQLEAGIGTDYVDGDVVLVFQDEARGGTSSIYKVESDVPVFKNAFDKTRQDLLSFTGNISADAEWSDVPAHSDPAFDVQAQALADRAEVLNKRTEGLMNVRAFIDTAIDGVTSNQAGIEAAVAAAYAAGAELEWPAGTYVSTGNIPNFWDVNHGGKGVIKRGENTFFITPSKNHTNTIHVSPSGSLGNDGISPSTATRISSIPNYLQSISGRSLNGNWRILFAAGTYTDAGIRPQYLTPFTRDITFEGAYDDSVSEHLSVWDGSGYANSFALRLDHGEQGQRILVKNLRFVNWTGTSNAGAIIAWYWKYLTTENVSIDNCNIGIWVGRNSHHVSVGDKISNCSTWGINNFYNSSLFLGQSESTRTRITNCYRGVMIGRMSIGHLDYCDFENNNTDYYISQNSRISQISASFKGWTARHAFIQNGSVVEGMDVAEFDQASITDETPLFLSNNGAIVDSISGEGTEVLHRSFAPNIPYQLTGTTGETCLTDKVGYGVWTRFPRYFLYQSKLMIRFSARIDKFGSGGAAKIRLCGQSSDPDYTILEFDLPSTVVRGVLNVTLEFRGNGRAYAHGELKHTDGTIFNVATISATTRDLLRSKTSENTGWHIFAKLENPADALTMYTQKTWVTY